MAIWSCIRGLLILRRLPAAQTREAIAAIAAIAICPWMPTRVRDRPSWEGKRVTVSPSVSAKVQRRVSQRKREASLAGKSRKCVLWVSGNCSS